jgi:hypothetical protein
VSNKKKTKNLAYAYLKSKKMVNAKQLQKKVHNAAEVHLMEIFVGSIIDKKVNN